MQWFLSEFISFQLTPKKNRIAFGSVGFSFLFLQLEHGYALTVFLVGSMACHAQLEVFPAYIVELCNLTS